MDRKYLAKLLTQDGEELPLIYEDDSRGIVREVVNFEIIEHKGRKCIFLADDERQLSK